MFKNNYIFCICVNIYIFISYIWPHFCYVSEDHYLLWRSFFQLASNFKSTLLILQITAVVASDYLEIKIIVISLFVEVWEPVIMVNWSNDGTLDISISFTHVASPCHNYFNTWHRWKGAIYFVQLSCKKIIGQFSIILFHVKIHIVFYENFEMKNISMCLQLVIQSLFILPFNHWSKRHIGVISFQYSIYTWAC